MTESVRPGSPPIGLTAPVRRATDLTGVLIRNSLRDVRIENVRVGNASLDPLVHRSDGSTAVEVLNRIGDPSVIVRV